MSFGSCEGGHNNIIMVVHLPPAAGRGGGEGVGCFMAPRFYLAIIIKIHRKLKVAPMSKIRRIKKAREEWLTFG